MKERLEILEVKPYGVVVRNLTHQIKQLIPIEKFKKRFKWNLYEVINMCSYPQLS